MIMNKFSCTLHIPLCTAMVWLSALFPCRCIYIADACWKHKNETHIYTALATCTEQCLATHLHIMQHLYRIMRHSHIPRYCIAGFPRGKFFTNQLPFVKILPLKINVYYKHVITKCSWLFVKIFPHKKLE